MYAPHRKPELERGVDPYRLYEARKQAWLAMNPEATHEQYEAAVKKIAEECGI